MNLKLFLVIHEWAYFNASMIFKLWLGLNKNYYMGKMFTKSSSTHFLHDFKTLILAINCMKVAKPNVDWWYTIFFLLLVWWNHNISLMVLLTYIGTSNFQHPHAVIPVLIKLNSRSLGKIWLWYRIIGKNKMLCFHKRSGS